MPRATEQRVVLLLKVFVWVIGLGPVAWLVYGWFQGNLGVNPIEKVILVQGRWTLVFLLAAMAVTPIRRLTGWNRIVQLRRLVGLFAFFHASLHFLAYAGLDQFFEWPYIVEDVIERPYITAGFTAFVLLLPLAVTSTRGWIRRLGKRWQRLHRLAYVAAALGVLHFFWKVKADTFWPLVSALLLAVLFGIRVWHRVQQTRRPRGGTSPPVAA
ncbi:MAG: sulfoxide reductase heme-binding subunit YedZ [Gemmatimonadota bacterium]|nr:sulfoxide reductase heme-binding subunit YedZ [Gemmatimonadota bacterium]